MDERASRILLGLSVLVLLWIAVYWLWQPASAEPRITWDQTPPAVQTRAVEPPTRSLTENRPRPVEPAPQATRKPEPDPQPQHPVVIKHPTPTGTTVIPPTFRDYTVRSGDTLEKIAKREFGKSSLWTVIAEANPLRDPRRLKPGDVIRIPLDPGNVQGKVVQTPPGAPEPAPAVASKPEPKPADPAKTEPTTDANAVVTYTVKPGDTLTGIARAYYGSQGFDEFIFFNNQDVLDSPDELKVGMTLKLPPIPGEG